MIYSNRVILTLATSVRAPKQQSGQVYTAWFKIGCRFSGFFQVQDLSV